MIDIETLRQSGAALASWSRTMLLSHERPDGDAFGALAGMKGVIEAAGRSATAFVYAPPPPRYRFLGDRLNAWPGGEAATLDAQFDGILIMDTCSWSQLETVAGYLRASRLPRMVVDHHATRDELADLYVIDTSAAAACTVLHQWCTVMGWRVPPPAAEALFAGIATDTGWFRFSNTDGPTLRASAALIEGGVMPDLMYARLMESYSPARPRLMAEMLRTLEWHAGGAIAIITITQEAIKLAGATASDTEDLVNEPLSVAGVVAVALLNETPDGCVRVNFRSKSPAIVGRDVNVAAVAQQFGGGGHHRSAGARIQAPPADARQQVLTAMLAAVAA